MAVYFREKKTKQNRTLPSRKLWSNCRSQQVWQCLSFHHRKAKYSIFPCCGWITGISWRPSEVVLQSIYRGNTFANFWSHPLAAATSWSQTEKENPKQQTPKLTTSKNKSKASKILRQQEQQQLLLPHIYLHWFLSLCMSCVLGGETMIFLTAPQNYKGEQDA